MLRTVLAAWSPPKNVDATKKQPELSDVPEDAFLFHFFFSFLKSNACIQPWPNPEIADVCNFSTRITSQSALIWWTQRNSSRNANSVQDWNRSREPNYFISVSQEQELPVNWKSCKSSTILQARKGEQLKQVWLYGLFFKKKPLSCVPQIREVPFRRIRGTSSNAESWCFVSNSSFFP